uniref:hypothetical protein n=1 Tax=Rheinheimera sp. TaxID=1869214 RepID=UPI004048B0B7
MLDALAAALNKVYDVNFDRRYWETILGYWLLVYLSTLLDRARFLRATSLAPDQPAYLSSGVVCETVDQYMTLAAHSDDWNRKFMYLINQASKSSETGMSPSVYYCNDSLGLKGTALLEDRAIFSYDTIRYFGMKGFKLGLSLLFSCGVRLIYHLQFGRRKVVFYNSYFSRLSLLKIALFAGVRIDFYHIRRINSLEKSVDLKSISHPLRDRLRQTLLTANIRGNELLRLAILLIDRVIPIGILEGYQASIKYIEEEAKETPKYVFTDNYHFSGSDLYRMWTAEVVRRGAVYV